MSSAMTDAVWELDLSPDYKFLLLELAFRANDEGRVPWGPPDYMSLMCSVTRPVAQKILRDFVESGVLVVLTSDTTSGQPVMCGLDLTKAVALPPPKRRSRRGLRTRKDG